MIKIKLLSFYINLIRKIGVIKTQLKKIGELILKFDFF